MGASSWICAEKTRPMLAALSPHSIHWPGNTQRFQKSSWESFEPRPKVLIASAVPTHTTCGSHVLVQSAIAQEMSLRIRELRPRRLLRPHRRYKGKKTAARVADSQAQARIGGGGCE